MATEYDEVMTLIRRKHAVAWQEYGCQYIAATEKELEALTQLGLPPSILEFYRNFNTPNGFEHLVTINNAGEVIELTHAVVPHCWIHNHGYVGFAMTACGDSYFFDLNNLDTAGRPAIVLFSHEHSFNGMSKAEVAKRGKRIANNLVDFLNKFYSETIDEETI